MKEEIFYSSLPSVTVFVCYMWFPVPSTAPSSFPASPALRSPMSVPPGSYPAHFGVVSHAGLNGELASPGGFGGALTLSPQISAAAGAYSRSPMVSKKTKLFFSVKVWFMIQIQPSRLSRFCWNIWWIVSALSVSMQCIHYTLKVVMFTLSNQVS